MEGGSHHSVWPERLKGGHEEFEDSRPGIIEKPDQERVVRKVEGEV